MKIILIRFFIVLAFLTTTGDWLYGQSKKITYQAEDIFIDRIDGERVRRLIQNVVFVQNNTTVYCDSSYFYRSDNIMKAYSNVKIINDSTVITSNKLTYEGDNRLAKLRESVVYTTSKNVLYTDVLDYYMDDEIARYWEGGRLVDSANTLTSRSGVFYPKQDYATFVGNVILVAPEYTLKTDTLRYNTKTKTAYADGYTEIENADGTQLFALGGIFRTAIDQSDFVQGEVETEEYTMKGENLYFDDLNKYYRGRGKVNLVAKEKDVIITGDDGFYDQTNGLAKVYGNAILKRAIQQDTFYMAADTMIMIESEFDSLKRILAYPDVRIFKTNMQGLADSAAYFLADSLISMYGAPIVWNEKSQITADTIEMEVTEHHIKKMFLKKNAFMISEDTLKNYNQIKGRYIEAFFKNNNMDFMLVDGNAESIFYSLEKGDSVLMGMNSLICGNMKIGFRDNQIAAITAFQDVDGRLIPPHELTPEAQKLSGFNWQPEVRPILADIFKKPENERQRPAYGGRRGGGDNRADPNGGALPQRGKKAEVPEGPKQGLRGRG